MKKKAQSLVEYGLILSLVAVISITLLTKFGGTVSSAGNSATNSVSASSDDSADDYCKEAVGSGSSYDSENQTCK